MNIPEIQPWMIWIIVWAYLAWLVQERRTTFGSAVWLSLWTAVRKRLFRNRGLLVGDWFLSFTRPIRWNLPCLLPIFYRHDSHCITISPAGSGKGTTAIIPNLLRWAWIFLLDPGGQNTAVACRHWRARGYTFYCVNPWRMHQERPWALLAHALNPMDILDPAIMTFVSDADVLADALIVRSGREDGSTDYFKNEAQTAIKALLMHIASTEPPERRTLLTLREYITADQDSWEELISRMKTNMAGGGAIQREATALERREAQGAGEELSAIMSTMKEATNFLDDPVMQEALCRSDIDLEDLKGN